MSTFHRQERKLTARVSKTCSYAHKRRGARTHTHSMSFTLKMRDAKLKRLGMKSRLFPKNVSLPFFNLHPPHLSFSVCPVYYTVTKSAALM